VTWKYMFFNCHCENFPTIYYNITQNDIIFMFLYCFDYCHRHSFPRHSFLFYSNSRRKKCWKILLCWIETKSIQLQEKFQTKKVTLQVRNKFWRDSFCCLHNVHTCILLCIWLSLVPMQFRPPSIQNSLELHQIFILSEKTHQSHHQSYYVIYLIFISFPLSKIRAMYNWEIYILELDL